MNKIKRIASMMLALLMVMTMSVTSAQAAAKTHTTGGNGCSGLTFTVKTGKTSDSRKLEFKQKKGMYQYQNIATGQSKANVYGKFTIFVQEKGGSTKAYSCSYKQTLSVKLDKNTTYKVSIVPAQNFITYRDLVNANKLKGVNFLGFNYGVGHWSTYPVYTISTKGTMSNVQNTSFSSSIY